MSNMWRDIVYTNLKTRIVDNCIKFLLFTVIRKHETFRFCVK